MTKEKKKRLEGKEEPQVKKRLEEKEELQVEKESPDRCLTEEQRRWLHGSSPQEPRKSRRSPRAPPCPPPPPPRRTSALPVVYYNDEFAQALNDLVLGTERGPKTRSSRANMMQTQQKSVVDYP